MRKKQRRIARLIAIVLFATHVVFAFKFAAADGFSYNLALEYIMQVLPASIIFMIAAIVLEFLARATDILAVGFIAAVVASSFAQIFGAASLAFYLLVLIGLASIIGNAVKWTLTD